MITIQETLIGIEGRLQRKSETPILDAQVLVAHILGKPRTWVLSHPEIQLDEAQNENITKAVKRLEQGEALPYVIGHWEFYGVDFYLTSDVLIPRPETELLVERGIEWLNLHPHACKAMDVGTGSGCIGIALALHIPDLHVLLTELSPLALKVARKNVERYALADRLELQQADLLEGIEGRYDLICANLPYIPRQKLGKLAVAKREPLLALDGGKGGIEIINTLLEQARSYLVPGGLMLLEIEASQGDKIMRLAQELYPASKIQVHFDLSGKDRCVEIERTRLIVHLCRKDEWLIAQERGIYEDESLRNEGFIHCSTPEQILQVANRFYRGTTDVVLLWIDPERISHEVRWEWSEGEIFPHIYGPIELSAIVKYTRLVMEEDGIYLHLHIPG